MNTLKCIAIILISTVYGCKLIQEMKKHPEANDKVTIKKAPIIGNDKSTLSGKIKNFKTDEPVEFAYVILQKDGKTTLGSSTDLNGYFHITDIESGKYILQIKSVEYKTIEMPIEIEKATALSLEAKIEIIQNVEEKPLIYIYPTEKKEISVRLNYQGILTHTYPAYPENGWKVTAETNGTLWDKNGLEYYGLFWEGKPKSPLIPHDGFIVAGKETAVFLEEKLACLGLNRHEANEFIMYWLPRLEDNPYNLIHFAGKAYEEEAELIISPKPETTIRVMMLTQALQSKIDFPLQDLKLLQKCRKGFTVVEWGGSVVNVPNL